MALSPDGAWWWDGSRWVPALSPDGRWRWNGQAWVPAGAPGPGRVVYQPSPWTPLLQRAVLAVLALGLVSALVVVANWGSLTDQVLNSPSFQQGLQGTSAAQAAQARDIVRQVMNVTGWIVVVVALLWLGLLAFGTLRLWRWVFWYQMIVGFLAVFSILSGIIQLAAPDLTGGGIVFPALYYVMTIAVAAIEVALSVWMVVALQRHGAWARRKTVVPF